MNKNPQGARGWRRTTIVGTKLLAAVSAAVLTVGLMSAPASAADYETSHLVSEVPATGTPHVLDGRVLSIVKVGNTMVIGGTFTRARNYTNTTEIPRSRVLSFNETTGTINTNFAPDPNGAVNVVLPTGDGQTVWVAGSFTSIGGVARSNLAKVRISDGSVVTAFNAGQITGQVKDLRLANGQLWIAGAFTHVGGKAQKALATVDPTTGALTNYFRGTIAGVHNGGYTSVAKIDNDPQQDRLVAVGNFDTLDDVKNRQFMVLDTSGATAAPSDLRTKFYETRCATAFDSYMRDVDVSPGGEFLVVTTTGAYGGSTTACDTSARFDFAGSGEDVRPSWINHTGGDTTYGVEVTDRVVYVGGHQRWQNNPFAGDRIGPGAVDRVGVAALDTVNGLPYSWNPSRSPGVGLFDFLVTDNGLWAVSDTERFGQGSHYRARVAFLPNNGGWDIPAIREHHLPNDVYLGGLSGAVTDPSVLYRVNASGSALEATSGIDWAGGHPSQYVTGNVNQASYATVGSVDDSVPSSTPVEVFSTEAWAGNANQPMEWNFPVPVGTEVSVRLYFANRYDGTASPGQRVFNVDLDGTRVLNNYDIVADVGHNRGVMKSFDITSDGQVDIDFRHVTENPLVNGIEIVLKDAGPGNETKVAKRTFDGTTPGALLPVPEGEVNWDAVRGAFMLNGEVYFANANGDFTKRTFDGTTWGSVEPVNAQDQLMVLADWRNDIGSMTGMFYDNGRIYFTRSGQNQLYYRYFTPESKVVGAYRYTASPNVDGVNYSTVRGMFQADGKLYWRTANGDLHSADWQQGLQSGSAVGGTAQLVSGPSNGGASWDARVPFLYQDQDGLGAPLPPTADFAVECSSLSCALDASDSVSPGTTIASYAWSFSDGTTATGKTHTKTFDTDGEYTIELTITTAKGGTSTTSKSVTVERVNEAPTAVFTSTCGVMSCSFDASGSSDDDEIASYDWDFGDGHTGTGVTASHDYDQPGSYTVKLTVTDSDDETAETSQDVEVQAEPSSDVAFVSSASSNGNRTAHPVTIPSSVQAGDRLLLFATANGNTTGSAPAGWEQVETVQHNGATSWVWTKVAVASDAGSSVSATFGSQLKGAATVVAYRSEAGTPSVAQSAANSVQGATSVPAPAVTAANGDWIVNFWGVKSSSAISLSADDVTERDATSGSGSGAVYTWLADSNGPVAAGQVGASATTSVSATRALMFTLALREP